MIDEFVSGVVIVLGLYALLRFIDVTGTDAIARLCVGAGAAGGFAECGGLIPKVSETCGLALLGAALLPHTIARGLGYTAGASEISGLKWTNERRKLNSADTPIAAPPPELAAEPENDATWQAERAGLIRPAWGNPPEQIDTTDEPDGQRDEHTRPS